MDIYIDTKITDILEKSMKLFYRTVLDEEPEYYDYYKTLDKNERFNNFIWIILEDKKTFKNFYNLLIDSNCKKNEINDFFYKYLKMKQKSEKKIWSWNEIDEFNIDDPEIKTTNKYKFF